MTPAGVGWWLDELSHAGAEHLDRGYVAGYEQKSPTDWGEDIAALQAFGIGEMSTVVDLGAGTGALARAIAPHVARVRRRRFGADGGRDPRARHRGVDALGTLAMRDAMFGPNLSRA